MAGLSGKSQKVAASGPEQASKSLTRPQTASKRPKTAIFDQKRPKNPLFGPKSRFFGPKVRKIDFLADFGPESRPEAPGTGNGILRPQKAFSDRNRLKTAEKDEKPIFLTKSDFGPNIDLFGPRMEEKSTFGRKVHFWPFSADVHQSPGTSAPEAPEAGQALLRPPGASGGQKRPKTAKNRPCGAQKGPFLGCQSQTLTLNFSAA